MALAFDIDGASAANIYALDDDSVTIIGRGDGRVIPVAMGRGTNVRSRGRGRVLPLCIRILFSISAKSVKVKF